MEIRYRAGDARAYRAGAGNLERIPGAPLLPDETCPAEGTAPPAAERTRTAKSAAKKRSGAETTAVPENAWIVYADGACSGNPGPAGLGIVLISPGKEEAEGFEYLGEGTNNIAELTAILRAAELLPKNVDAVLHTDSQYSIGVLTKGWKAKANRELVAKVKAALQKQPRLALRYVPGHSGVLLNERADELARKAVATRSSSLPAKLPV